MNFGQALEALKNGYKIKLPSWKGYWVKEGDTVKMHCKDGSVLDIRETQDVFYTLGNIVSEEWEIVGDCDIDLNVHTFAFGEAIRRLKAGQKVARKGWNGRGMFVRLIDETIATQSLGNALGRKMNPYFIIKNVNDFISTWVPSIDDCLAEDWEVVE